MAATVTTGGRGRDAALWLTALTTAAVLVYALRCLLRAGTRRRGAWLALLGGLGLGAAWLQIVIP